MFHSYLQMRPLVEMENSGLVALLQQDQNEDLARMHTLFRRVQGGHDLIRTILADHLRKTGRQLVEDPERNKDPVDFVQRLLAEKDKFDRCAGPEIIPLQHHTVVPPRRPSA